MSEYKPDIIVDVIGETCPIPLVEMRKALMKMENGQVVEVRGNHNASKQEIPMAVDSLGFKLLDVKDTNNGIWHILIQK